VAAETHNETQTQPPAFFRYLVLAGSGDLLQALSDELARFKGTCSVVFACFLFGEPKAKVHNYRK
jgi:hypothetical protein